LKERQYIAIMAQAIPPPDLHIPHSKNTVMVSVIDTTAFIGISASKFVEPPMLGNEKLHAACYAFLVKHSNPNAESKYDTLLFDLGVRKDIENAPKVLHDMLDDPSVTIKVDKNVGEILKDNGEDPDGVGAIVWSHWHFVSIYPAANQ